jgi:hypothetical protein
VKRSHFLTLTRIVLTYDHANYSCRKAFIGSVRIARRAGT